MSAEPVVHRPVGGRILTIGCAAVALFGAVLIVIETGPVGLVRWVWPLAAFAWLVWLLYWHPQVTVTEGFVDVQNVLRRHRVPWSDLDDVTTRFALTLRTRSRGEIRAWAAPAPGIRSAATMKPEQFDSLDRGTRDLGSLRPSDNPETLSGSIALDVQRRWHDAQRAGRAEGTAVTVSTWDLPQLAVSAALLLAAVLAFAL